MRLTDKQVWWIRRGLWGFLLVGLVLFGYSLWQQAVRYGIDWQRGTLALELVAERYWYRLSPGGLPQDCCSQVSVETLQQRLALGADWLVEMMEPSGRFQYWYEPAMDLYSTATDDNFLRQAGTAFSLASAYETGGDQRYLVAAEKSVDYLLQFKKQLDAEHSYFLFNEKAKLGGIALPMLTMLKVRQLNGDKKYDPELLPLANMILWLQQQYQTGQFKSTYVYRGNHQYEKSRGWESQIYPGEAIYALAQMHLAFGDERYKRAIDRAIAYYSKQGRWENHAFLSWTITGCRSMFEQTGEQHYADFALEMGDFLLTQQNMDIDDRVFGSFHAFPAANTGTYLEGLGDALRVAQLVEDDARSKRYSLHFLAGLGWIYQLQCDQSEAATLKNPARALGGVRQSLDHPMMRIDNTQHSISAMTKALAYVFQQPPVAAPPLSATSPVTPTETPSSLPDNTL